jgi:hypothetical protein
MKEKEYYAVRNGHVSSKEVLSFENLKKAFLLIYKQLNNEGYFQKYYGKDCPDGDVIGKLGEDIPTAIYLKTFLQNLWPINYWISYYDEIQFYTIVEFLHNSCSKPVETDYHRFNDCGIHVISSDDEAGGKEFRQRINPLLKRFKKIELTENGDILESIEEGFETLINAKIPSEDSENIVSRINAAVIKFRRASSTLDDRRDALRNLADVLEYTRKQVERLPMSKDTNELFRIANDFGIRHHNTKQKTDYDTPTWHAWIFYCYLSTIHLCLRLIEKSNV